MYEHQPLSPDKPCPPTPIRSGTENELQLKMKSTVALSEKTVNESERFSKL